MKKVALHHEIHLTGTPVHITIEQPDKAFPNMPFLRLCGSTEQVQVDFRVCKIR